MINRTVGLRPAPTPRTASVEDRQGRSHIVISSFFDPASIAVVGAADDPAKLRGKLFALALATGGGRPVHPVHPAAATIQGVPAFPSLTAIPGGAELVMIATPGNAVPAVVREAGQAGAKAAVILSSGVDARALADAAAESGLRYLGPNTEGYYALGGVAATFAAVVDDALGQDSAAPAPGRKVSIVSQSGGLGFCLFGRGLAENLAFHAVITTGNEGDLDCLDFVDHLLDEGETGVIVMFIEGLKNPARLPEVAAKAADRGVTIVAMKIGRSEAGQRAAVSHTAHLTGADTAYDAVFERAGVVRVFDMEELLAAAAAFARLPPGRVRRVAVVSTSGGAGAWAADILASAGFDVPVVPAALQAELLENIPAFGSAANPVDVTAQAVEAGGRPLIEVLEKLERSDEIDAIVVNMGLQKQGRIDALADLLGPLHRAARKPILFHSHILPAAENMRALAMLGGQAFASFRGCAWALAALDRHAVFQEAWARRVPSGPPHPRSPVADTFGGGVLDAARTAQLLAAYGIAIAPAVLAGSAAEAVAAARDMAGPVVLKIQSPDIAHKTEAGGVALDIGLQDVEAAYHRILSNAAAHAPGARVEGVLVQKMMPKGREMVVGITRDPDFGPLLMLGTGGIYLEVLKDVVFAPPPIAPAEARALIARLKLAPLLEGVRGEAQADLDALAELVSRVAELARVERNIDQLDLNPVLVYPAGQGAVAVDALVVAGSSGGDQ